MKRLSAVGFIIACVLLVIIGATQLQSPLAHGKSIPPSAGQMPAIHPDAAKFKAQSLPTFTNTDVEQYLQTDPVIGQDLSSRPGFQHTITFIDSKTLGNTLNDDFSKDATTLCYVEFTGPAPFALRDAKAVAPPRFSKAYEVFDGLTGNLITWGGIK
jgi:hypothetical protein